MAQLQIDGVTIVDIPEDLATHLRELARKRGIGIVQAAKPHDISSVASEFFAVDERANLHTRFPVMVQFTLQFEREISASPTKESKT